MIDIYKINDGKKCYYKSIVEKDLLALYKVFLEYETKTGHKLDEYGDLIIKNDNLDILLDVFKEYMRYEKKDYSIIDSYYILLKNIKKEGVDIGFFGD